MIKNICKRTFCAFVSALMIINVSPVSLITANAADQQNYLTNPDVGASSGWKVAYPAGGDFDAVTDPMVGNGSTALDIVGDATFPSSYIRFSEDGSEIAIRLRLNNCDGTAANPQFKSFAYLGIDANLDGAIDFFLGVYSPTGAGRLAIYPTDPSAPNNGPGITGIAKPAASFQPINGVNYSIVQTADGSSFSGDPDYFLSFKFNVSDITNALANLTPPITFTSTTPFAFIMGTATQDNTLNGDTNGLNDKNPPPRGTTWADTGILSDPISTQAIDWATVTFDKNSGDTDAIPNRKVVQKGAALTSLPFNPSKRAMVFQGWNTQPDGTGDKFTAGDIVNDNITVYAIWSDKAVATISFDPNGGNWGGSTAVMQIPTTNGIIGLDNMPPNPTHPSGYKFAGWTTTKQTVPITLNSFPAVDYLTSDRQTSDLATLTPPNTVYALWVPSTATLSADFYDNIDGAGGNYLFTMYAHNSGSITGTPPNATRLGYTFAGWYNTSAATGGTAFSTSLKITAGEIFYARWTKTDYTITYDMNDGNYPGTTDRNGVPATALSTDGYFVMQDDIPTRAGYMFNEWNRLADGTGEEMSSMSIISVNTTVYAIWDAVTPPHIPVYATVTFNATSGQFVDETNSIAVTATDGFLPFIPTPESVTDVDGTPLYVFAGWSFTEGGSADISINTWVSDPRFFVDATLYAVWKPVYTVTFYPRGGVWEDGGINAVKVGTDDNGYAMFIPGYFGIPDNGPAREDYNFAGWNAAIDGSGSVFHGDTPVTSSLNVYAQWDYAVAGIDMVEINYDLNDGTGGLLPGDYTAERNQLITPPADPSRDGWVFTGWYKEPDCVNKWNFNTDTVTEDLTILYAGWTEESTLPDTYAATLAVNKDGSAWTGSGKTFTIKLSSDETVTADISGGTASVGNGTWKVYDGADYTGTDIMINNGAGTAALNYYTITYSVSHAGDATGSSITATYGGTAITSGSVALGGGALVITASGTGADGYTYLWGGTASGTGAAYTTTVGAAVNAACVVTGSNNQYAATLTVNKDGSSWTGSGKTFTIKLSADETVTADISGGAANVGNGTWKVYDGADYTGTDIMINNGAGTAALNYYTITYSVSHAGDATGSSITATYGGTAITSGSVALGGGTLVITASGTGADGYTYSWGGTASGTGAAYTTTVGAAVNATCVVTGHTNRNVPPYSVSGVVKDENNNPLNGADVFITQSGNTIKSGETDAAGGFLLDGLSPGVYDLIIVYADNSGSETTVTLLLEITDHDEDAGVIKITIARGRLNSKFVNGDGTHAIAVGGLNDVYAAAGSNPITDERYGVTSDNLSVYDAGGDITIRLEAREINPQNDAGQIQNVQSKAASDGKDIGFMMYLSVYKDVTSVNSSMTTTLLYKLNGLVNIYIPLDPQYRGKTGYVVYRYHTDGGAGSVDTITTVPNADGEYFTISSAGDMIVLTVKNFSVYAIAYDNNAGGTNNGGSSSNSAPQDQQPSNPGGTGVDTSGGSGTTNYSQNPGGGSGGTSSDVSDNSNGGSAAGNADDINTNADGSDVSGLLNTNDHMAYVVGRGNSMFAPNAGITRAEAAQLFYNLLLNKNVKVTALFPDVPDDAWYATAVNTLATLDIIAGFPDGGYHPDEDITRAQFAAIAVRFAKVSPGKIKFTDVPETHWAYDYISTAANYGWVMGVGDGRFEPDRNITRAEAVTMVNKILKRNPDKEYINSLDEMLRYSDVPTSYWAYYDIMEASVAHSYERFDETEIWTGIIIK